GDLPALTGRVVLVDFAPELTGDGVAGEGERRDVAAGLVPVAALGHGRPVVPQPLHPVVVLRRRGGEPDCWAWDVSPERVRAEASAQEVVPDGGRDAVDGVDEGAAVGEGHATRGIRPDVLAQAIAERGVTEQA